MFRSALFAALSAAALAAAPASAITVINFDNLGETYTGGAYQEGGYVLSGNFCNSFTGNCIEAINPDLSIDPTGTSVVKASGAATTFTVARADGGAFKFGSMDFGKTTTIGTTYLSALQFNFTLADPAQTVLTRRFTFLHQNPTPIVAHTAIFDDIGEITQFTFRGQAGGYQFDNIRVESVAAIPEPGTWAMMLGGFGLVGFAARRRRGVAAA